MKLAIKLHIQAIIVELAEGNHFRWLSTKYPQRNLNGINSQIKDTTTAALQKQSLGVGEGEAEFQFDFLNFSQIAVINALLQEFIALEKS